MNGLHDISKRLINQACRPLRNLCGVIVGTLTLHE